MNENQEYRCKYCGAKTIKYLKVCTPCSIKLKLIREIKQRLLLAKKRGINNAK